MISSTRLNATIKIITLDLLELIQLNFNHPRARNRKKNTLAHATNKHAGYNGVVANETESNLDHTKRRVVCVCLASSLSRRASLISAIQFIIDRLSNLFNSYRLSCQLCALSGERAQQSSSSRVQTTTFSINYFLINIEHC